MSNENEAMANLIIESLVKDSIKRVGVNAYSNIHMYIRYHFGNATHCSNPDCPKQNSERFEWALIKGRSYSKDIRNYTQLCQSCHRKYDVTDEIRKQISLRMLGKPSKRRRKIVRIDSIGGIIIYESIVKAA